MARRTFLPESPKPRHASAPSLSTRVTSSADCQRKNGCTASQQSPMFRRSSFPSYANIICYMYIALCTDKHQKSHNCFLGFILIFFIVQDCMMAERGGSQAENGSSHLSWLPLRLFKPNPVYIAAVAP